MQAHALLHRAGREIDDRGRVVATLEDYAEVRELVADVMSHTLGQSVSDATREAVETVARLVDAGASHVTYADLARELGLDRSTVNRRTGKRSALGRGSTSSFTSPPSTTAAGT